MARARNRTAPLGRLLDAASQPLYILDEDRRIVFANTAFRRWLGAAAEELLGRRCAYHTATSVTGPDALATALCPPPAAFTGKRCTSVVVLSDEHHQVRRRQATFLPLGDMTELVAVIALVDDIDLPDDYRQPPGRDDAPPSESEQLHEQLRQFHQEQAAEFTLDRLVGTSPAIRRARAQATVASATRSTVAIVGPKGSGKQRLARTVHFGVNSEQPGTLVPLDCAVLGGDLVRSTAIALAAQDSTSECPGGNTLLLNGAETIGPEAQGELARILFDRPFPLRTIATSTCRLVELASRNEYHPKLALGLSTVEIELSPLAERTGDLGLLVQAFVEEINAEGGKQIAGPASETLDLLAGYAWPGNVDELASVIAEAHASADGPELRPADIPERIHQALEAAARPRPKETTIQLDDYLAEIERELVQRAMQQAKGNKTKAASLLGLNRPRLYRRLLQLGLIEEETSP